MKVAIFFALIALSCAKLSIPEKCEDVLAVKVCDRVEKTAKALKLKSEEVKAAVKDAYQKGKKTAEEIEQSINEFLVNKVYNKKCEDFTSAEICSKLRKFASDSKIQADKVKKFVLEEFVKLKAKTCEDFVTVDQCAKLKEFASQAKMRAEELQEKIIAAYLEAKEKGTKRVIETYNKVKDYIMSTKCEDMFNPDLCTSFRKYAEKTKVALPRIVETAFDLVKKGVAIGKSLADKVYNIVDYFYDCTDVFDEKSCDRLKNWAAKFKVKAEELEKAVKKYVRVFIEKGTTIYKTIKDFVKEKIYCKFSSKCSNAEDEIVVVSKRSIFGDWKNKIRNILNNKFPNLEVSARAYVEKLINKSRSFYAFMRNVAKDIKENAQARVELLKKLMMEATS